MKNNNLYKIFNIIYIVVSFVMVFLMINSYIGKYNSFSDYIYMLFVLLFAGILNWELISIIFSFIHLKNGYTKPTTIRNEVIFYVVALIIVVPSFFMIDFLLFMNGWAQKSTFSGSVNFDSPFTIFYSISIGVSIFKLILDIIIYKKNKKSITTK